MTVGYHRQTSVLGDWFIRSDKYQHEQTEIEMGGIILHQYHDLYSRATLTCNKYYRKLEKKPALRRVQRPTPATFL